MSDTVYYSSVGYDEHESTQGSAMVEQLAKDLDGFISCCGTNGDDLRLCIYGSGKSGITAYNALGLKNRQSMVSYFVDQASRGCDSGIIRDPAVLNHDRNIDAVILATHPHHYPSIMNSLFKEGKNGKKMFFMYLPDFRSNMLDFSSIQCPGDPVVLCSHAYDGHISRILMELLGALHYDYRFSISNQPGVFSNLKAFTFVDGNFSYDQFRLVKQQCPNVKFIYYYRNLRDLLYFRYCVEKVDLPEIQEIEDRIGLGESLKTHFNGYTAANGKHLKPITDEALEQRRWLEDNDCFFINHDMMDETNIARIISDAMAFAGNYCTRSLIEKAVSGANHIIGKTHFHVSKNAWQNTFDSELIQMFESVSL